MVSLASSSENFISQVCEAFRKAVERASGVTLEGREREFRRVLARYLFDEVLGWERYSKVGEIYDIACFDDENFPIIIIETKWRVELTREIKERLRRRIEGLGSVKYGVFASEREFIVYMYEDYKLREITKVNVAELVGVARKDFGLSEVGKRRVLKLETLKRERLVWIEEPAYFKETYKEVSVAKGEGVKLLIQNLKDIVKDLTATLMNFFDSCWKREDYSGRFLRRQFSDWLKHSMKDEEFKKRDEEGRRKIIEVFCRETAYVLVGRILFTRTCEDKEILKPLSLSGEGLAESLRFYEKRKRKNPYLVAFDGSREVIKKYYSHFYELGFFDWWWISPDKLALLTYDDRRVQDTLEEELNYSIKKTLKRLNRFDFTQVNRDILGDVYQGYLPPDERKRLGEFYTPKEVIEYILDAVGYKPENEIRSKKILDPACGSGGFLVEAIQRLIERYRRVGFNLKDPYDARQIIEGCVNSIYGLDIHPFACFIAEMNILFQLVDLYDVLKERYYELPRLNIYRTDSLMHPGEPIELTEFLDNSRRIMLIEETKGANIVKSDIFDYVVGNPPYVRVQELPGAQKEYFRQHYKSARGSFDIYVLFLERGVKWLNKCGKLGFITSNQYMVTHYGKILKRIILNNTKILQMIDFGDSGVFKEVTNYPAIIILERISKKDLLKKNVIKAVIVSRPMENILEDIRKNFGKKEYLNEFYSLFDYPQAKLNVDVWKLMRTEEIKIFEKIEKNANFKFKDITERIFQGLRTSANKIYLAYVINEEGKDPKTNKNLVRIKPIGEDFEYIIEKDLLKPFLKGEEIRRWKVTWRGLYVIHPYKLLRNKDGIIIGAQFYSQAELQKEFPLTWKYYLAHKNELENRERGRMKGRPDWYGYIYPKNLDKFERPKIIFPNIINTNSFTYDGEGWYFTAGYAVLLKGSISFEDYAYILALLNSKVLEFYFKHIATIKSGKYYDYRSQYVEKFPIKFPQTSGEKEITEKIIKDVDQIFKLNKHLSILMEKIEKFPISYFEIDWSFDKLANVAKVHLSKSSYKISEKTIRTYSFRELEYPFREVSRIILATKEHIDFYSEEVASYVFEVLKTMNRITKREFLELKIPPHSHLKNLMNQYRENKEQMDKNTRTIDDVEKQIDDLVYKLYGIAYIERRIIEDFLKKF